jgi:hypothetical protein
MDLKEFYDGREVSEKDRVVFPKNIALTVPAKDYDAKPAIAALGLSRFEVNVLWPKEKLSPEEEVLFLHPRLVVQLGKQFSRRFPFVPEGSLPDESLKVRALEATADNYVVLHHHDEFSLQDGLGTAAHLGDLLVEQRRSFMAITNHGSIGGWIKQHNVCKSLGLKCIFGCEVYVEHYRGDDPEEKKKHRSAFHLVLLARTKEGFDNLIRIHNDAQLNGFYYSPRVNWEAIKKWGKGLVALTACFPPGTLVETSHGFQEIESITSEVLTSRNRFREATMTQRNFSGTMKKVLLKGVSLPIVSTDDHQFFVVKAENQKKTESSLIPLEDEYASVDKQFRNARRRVFRGEWTSELKKGDWLVYPIAKTEADVSFVDCRPFNRGTIQEGMLRISSLGGQELRKIRKQKKIRIFRIINAGYMTKQTLYRLELRHGIANRNNLFRYLDLLGIDKEYFASAFCSDVYSDDRNLHMNRIPDEVKVTDDLLFLLGIYCAEGSTNKANHSGIGFALNIKEKTLAKKIKDCLFSVFGLSALDKERPNSNGRDVTLSSVPLVRLFDSLCGHGAANKRIPEFIWNLPFHRQKWFLKGLFLGDGYNGKARLRSGRRVVIGLISQKLILGVARLLLRGNYYPTCWQRAGRTDKNGVNHASSYFLSLSGKQTRYFADFVWNDQGDGSLPKSMWVRNNIPIVIDGHEYYTSSVLGVEKRNAENTTVRCLNVVEDHSFVVGFASVHNCAAGEVPRALMAGDEAKAEEAFKVYTESFDKVYVELQIIEMEEQREINRRLIKFAEKVGAETVLSSDSHYLDPTHTETHSLLMYIRQKKTILEARELDADVWDFDVGNLFYRTAAQMEEPFHNGFTTKDHVKRAPFLDDVFTEDVFRRSMAKTRQVAMDIEDISLDSKIKLPKLSDDSEKVLREKVNAGFKRLMLHEAPNSQE